MSPGSHRNASRCDPEACGCQGPSWSRRRRRRRSGRAVPGVRLVEQGRDPAGRLRGTASAAASTSSITGSRPASARPRPPSVSGSRPDPPGTVLGLLGRVAGLGALTAASAVATSARALAGRRGGRGVGGVVPAGPRLVDELGVGAPADEAAGGAGASSVSDAARGLGLIASTSAAVAASARPARGAAGSSQGSRSSSAVPTAGRRAGASAVAGSGPGRGLHRSASGAEASMVRLVPTVPASSVGSARRGVGGLVPRVAVVGRMLPASACAFSGEGSPSERPGAGRRPRRGSSQGSGSSPASSTGGRLGRGGPCAGSSPRVGIGIRAGSGSAGGSGQRRRPRSVPARHGGLGVGYGRRRSATSLGAARPSRASALVPPLRPSPRRRGRAPPLPPPLAPRWPRGPRTSARLAGLGLRLLAAPHGGEEHLGDVDDLDVLARDPRTAWRSDRREIITRQNGQPMAIRSAPVAMASSVRLRLMRVPSFSSIHIRAPPAPQQKERLTGARHLAQLDAGQRADAARAAGRRRCCGGRGSRGRGRSRTTPSTRRSSPRTARRLVRAGPPA